MVNRPCLTCGTPAAGSYCPTHDPGPWAGSTRKHTLPPGWAAIAASVRQRDGNACVLCGSTVRLSVDHMGDRHDHRLEALRTLCHLCHGRRSGQQGAAARNRG